MLYVKLRTAVFGCKIPGIVTYQTDMLPVHWREMALL